ncbi:MAG: methyltransferase domain-containing protein [Chitinophagales bacterium]
MKHIDFNNKYEHTHQERFRKTLNFMKPLVQKSDKVLDLGPSNPFSEMLVARGFDIENTIPNIDLDLDYQAVCRNDIDVVTAFEIFEHLVSPFPLLQAIEAPKLLASVPLNLWFAKAYWNDNDPFDRHYHEFEPRQFDMLLEKAGWKIIKSEKWLNKSKKIGFRPFLRNFVPRHYIVYCERATNSSYWPIKK